MNDDFIPSRRKKKNSSKPGGPQIFLKSMSYLKILEAKLWYEASSIMTTHRLYVRHHGPKFSRVGFEKTPL